MSTLDHVDVSRPSPFSILVWSAVVALEVALVGIYVTVANVDVGLFHLYPFVWINVGVWAVARTTPTGGTRRQKSIAGAVAVGYFLVLAAVGGLFATSLFTSDWHAHGLRLEATLPPGYGPALFYSGSWLLVSLVPYQLVGYLSLAYLVYVTVLDAARSAAGGVVGLFACVSCAWPILASLTTGTAGAGTAVATAVYAQAYELSTVAFVLTVALLYWRPLAR
ncbi:DUF7546 family protein [Natrialbaceae archaeon AArc-T1-2]|uniref:DUF7546 family protein n=1 Tax=Natrialbaceae archaeon AArc-T1-2 TaxID=3053904 RepID=UPI00255B4084|nr:hypothetical protein [Natrialbaceae archaeon AArc-T1-2]WIV66857.1 hypothetical protein QQ977_14360 [Natrialbaceae archaeon AArc-T1-2]